MPRYGGIMEGVIKRVLMKWFDLENLPCESCETLKAQLEIANYEKKQMLETILSFTKPVVEIKTETRDIEPIIPKTVPWAVKRRMIEAEDRRTAQLKREKEVEIAELEKELGVSDAS